MTLFSGVATATRSRRQQPGSAHAVEKAHDNLVGRAPARTLSTAGTARGFTARLLLSDELGIDVVRSRPLDEAHVLAGTCSHYLVEVIVFAWRDR